MKILSVQLHYKVFINSLTLPT